ncbi:MAG TPA: glycosyltransferase [Gemmatimonadaceae bacterium]|nr:glycosyltransferase [Gemmatimonadaceae bacterium]
MRILHFIGTLKTGGAERQLSILSRAQASFGHEVHVGFGESGPFHSEMSQGGVQMHPIEKRSNRDIRILRSVRDVLCAVKPDVVQTWLPQMDAAAGLLCVVKNIPWVMTERTCRAAYRMSSTTDLPRLVLGYFADAVVANSDAGREMWARRSRSRTFVIRNALDLDAIANAPIATEASIGFSRPYILVAGRLTASKNIELLLDVADDICESTDANVVFCGDGPLESMVRERVKRKRRSDRIVLFGSRPDIWGLMKAATAFVSASKFEGQPNAALEAMACGCPLIVSNIPAHSEFLNASSAFFVPRLTKTCLAEAIKQTLADSGLRAARADEAFRMASTFTPARAAQSYDLVYDYILSRRQ